MAAPIGVALAFHHKALNGHWLMGSSKFKVTGYKRQFHGDAPQFIR
jgi:hypothetical protein